MDGAREQLKNLAAGVAMRASSFSCSLHAIRSVALATRSAISVAASTSTAMSASTLLIIGRSAKGVPKALRGVSQCQGERLAHQARRADREIQARQVRMRQDFADAAALFSDTDGQGT